MAHDAIDPGALSTTPSLARITTPLKRAPFAAGQTTLADMVLGAVFVPRHASTALGLEHASTS